MQHHRTDLWGCQVLLQGPHSHAGIAQNSIATDQCIVRGSRQHAQAIMGTNSPAIPVASSMTLNTAGNPPHMADARTTNSVMTGTTEA